MAVRLLVAAWMLLGGCAGQVHAGGTKTMDTCPVTARPGDDLQGMLDQVPEGGMLCLTPGRYVGRLRIGRAATIRAQGRGEVVLDAEFGGTVVHVACDRGPVVLEGLTLTGGNGSQGGALAVTGMGAEVLLRGCSIVRNRARTKWLGAVITVTHDNQVVLERCRIGDIEGDDASGPGQAVAVTQAGKLVVKDSLVVERTGKGGSLIAARDGASIVIERSTLVVEGDGRALDASGTTTDQPAVTVLDSIVSGGEAIHGENASILVERSVVHGDIVGPVTLGRDTRRADPAFEGRGPEPYRPSGSSPAVGLARGRGRDLAGRERPEHGATAGAFEK